MGEMGSMVPVSYQTGLTERTLKMFEDSIQVSSPTGNCAFAFTHTEGPRNQVLYTMCDNLPPDLGHDDRDPSKRPAPRTPLLFNSLSKLPNRLEDRPGEFIESSPIQY